MLVYVVLQLEHLCLVQPAKAALAAVAAQLLFVAATLLSITRIVCSYL